MITNLEPEVWVEPQISAPDVPAVFRIPRQLQPAVVLPALLSFADREEVSGLAVPGLDSRHIGAVLHLLVHLPVPLLPLDLHCPEVHFDPAALRRPAIHLVADPDHSGTVLLAALALLLRLVGDRTKAPSSMAGETFQPGGGRCEAE